MTSERSAAPHRVLLVDDDASVLDAYGRTLGSAYSTVKCTSASDAIAELERGREFSVVLSDLQMPGMDGIELLERCSLLAPRTVRVLLTGRADISAAVRAVNQGRVFRFLEKPCDRDDLRQVVGAAVRQFELELAEERLLEDTLSGAIQVCAEILANQMPAVARCTARSHALAVEVAHRAGMQWSWPAKVAANLVGIGYTTVPPVVLARQRQGKRLTAEEEALLDAVPLRGAELLERVPRLEGAAEIIRYSGKGYDGSGLPEGGLSGDEIPEAARILKIVHAFGLLQLLGWSDEEAMGELRSRAAEFDPALMAVVERVVVEGAGSSLVS